MVDRALNVPQHAVANKVNEAITHGKRLKFSGRS